MMNFEFICRRFCHAVSKFSPTQSAPETSPTCLRCCTHSKYLAVLFISYHLSFKSSTGSITECFVESIANAAKPPMVCFLFSGSLDEHMHLLLPALVRLFRPDVSNAPIEIRSAAIKTLARLLPRMQVYDFSYPTASISAGVLELQSAGTSFRDKK